MIKQIIASLLVVWASGSGYAQAQTPHEFSYCEYVYYAVAGSAFMPLVTNSEELLHQLDGREMPFYVGYVKMELEPNIQRVLSLEHSKETDLYIYAIDYFLTKIVRDKKVSRYTHYVDMSDPDFYLYFGLELSDKGLKRIEHEFHPFRNCPDGPTLTATDFEFEETCIFRPFADPPELCLDLKVKLKNDPLGKRSNPPVE